MGLSQLNVHNVRNLRQVSLRDLGVVNIFYGANGSGKTSVLESIHLLGMARSFRGASAKTLITHGQEACTVYGITRTWSEAGKPVTLGVQREQAGGVQIKVAGQPVRVMADLLAQLPLQVINAASFELLTGPPATRRQYLNWGVFHVEHRFLGEWQRFQRCIKQRNTLLRRGKISAQELRVWTRDLAEAGHGINSFRLAYFSALAPRFREIMERLLPSQSEKLQLHYRQGWDKKLDYAQALEQSHASDQDQGYTHVGPQRADIKVTVDGYPAAETLSRGQQKLVVCGLKLAQGQLMAAAGRGECTYLVDDLPSELDKEHCRQVCAELAAIPSQVFITCVESSEVAQIWPDVDPMTMFHVEHGAISKANAVQRPS